MDAKKLAYRGFEIATQKKWSAEALVYNKLVQEWTKLEDIALNLEPFGEQILRCFAACLRSRKNLAFAHSGCNAVPLCAEKCRICNHQDARLPWFWSNV